jgi:hypothetical protein
MGPVVASIAAIAISILALLEQRSVDVGQAVASQRQEAEQVSFLQETSPTGSDDLVVVANLGTGPAHFPILLVLIGSDVSPGNSKETKTELVDVHLNLNDIPACSTATIDINQTIKKGAQNQNLKAPLLVNPALQFPVFVESLTFADSNGLIWTYFSDGGLQQQPKDEFQQEINSSSSSSYLIVAHINYKPANGCS